MPLMDDIRAYLLANNVAGAPNWPVYLGYYPDDQDQMIGIFETGGLPADTLGRENERVTFQVRIRASRLDYTTDRTKWKDIFDLLQDSIPASGYIFVQAVHYAPMMFNDDRGRPNMTANFRVMKARS